MSNLHILDCQYCGKPGKEFFGMDVFAPSRHYKRCERKARGMRHKIVRIPDHWSGEPVLRYLCNQAVSPTPKKSTRWWFRVTCKNCLKRRVNGLFK